MSAERAAVVTGSEGFLGRRFVTALEGHGYRVRGVDLRRTSPTTTVGDITVSGEWTRLLEDADLVVHTAAVVGDLGSARQHWRVNAGGTATVVRAATQAGVARFLHLSSKVVYGDDFPDGIDETGPVRPTGVPYTDTKIAAEHEVLRAGAAGDIPVTVVRFGDVYGPGSEQWIVRPLQLLRRRLAVLPAMGRGVLTPTYVDDAVAGALAAATSDAGVDEVFNITGGEGIATADYFRPLGAAVGRPVPRVPTVVARVTAAALEAGFRVVGRRPPATRHAVNYLVHPGTYDIGKAAELLGWHPRVGFDEGMAASVAWAREVGLLDGSVQ